MEFSRQFSRESCWPRDQTQVSCIVGRFFTIWAIRAAKIYIYMYVSGVQEKNHIYALILINGQRHLEVVCLQLIFINKGPWRFPEGLVVSFQCFHHCGPGSGCAPSCEAYPRSNKQKQITLSLPEKARDYIKCREVKRAGSWAQGHCIISSFRGSESTGTSVF